MVFKDIKLPSNKKFALFFSLVFSIIGLYLFYKGLSRYGSLSLVVASLFVCIAFIKPALVSPLNKAWMFIGFAMGKIISPLVLGGIFFLLITPLALILKISGRDELKLQKMSVESYWKTRDEKTLAPTSFKNQF